MYGFISFFCTRVGLRERFELSRQISKSTVGVARARAGRAASDEGRLGEVLRKDLILLFTDVRGFTPHSVRTDPARVIAILNNVLGDQEEIVDSCSG